MRKILMIPLMLLAFLSLAACSPTEDEPVIPETAFEEDYNAMLERAMGQRGHILQRVVIQQ